MNNNLVVGIGLGILVSVLIAYIGWLWTIYISKLERRNPNDDVGTT